MTESFEDLHPRARDGAFRDKPQSAPEAVLSGRPAASTVWVKQRINEEFAGFDAGPTLIHEVTESLNASQDYSTQNLTSVANEVNLRLHGTSLSALVGYQSALLRLRSIGGHHLADGVEQYVEELTERAELVTPAAPVDTRFAVASDPRVQAGEIFDRVAHDGITFHRRTDEVFPNEPYAMRIQTNWILSSDERSRLAGLIGFSWKKLGGEPVSDPVVDSPFSFIVYADSTKGSGDISRFEDGLADTIRDGSDPRKTNRSGPVGSRLIEGLGDGITYELYYDSVYDASNR